MMTSDPLYVWIYLPEQTRPVVAGRLDVARTGAGAVGTFIYGRSYLAHSGAIPIDPVALPLKAGPARFAALSGFPGAILDACPDRWGISVIDRLIGKQDYPSGYLLVNDPGRTGNLAFSEAPTEPPVELLSQEISLPVLMAAAEDVEAGRPADPEILKALHPGTGGARPKCSIVVDNEAWIAKFPSIEDDSSISIPRLEHAVMSLADQCDIDVAQTQIKKVAGKDVCLVRRFDRTVDAKLGVLTRKGFISARSIFYADPGFATVATGSYARIARWMSRYGCAQSERLQLFRRMVFNCAVRNTDDHDLNHGLIHVEGAKYALSPAYDIVPGLAHHKVHHHALLIGESAAGTLSNLRSASRAFGLSSEEALDIAHDVVRKIEALWRDVFYEAGFGDAEIRRFEQVFRPIPERSDEAAASLRPRP